MLARHVASPCYEMLWFIRLARRHGFQPLVIEHRSDRFTVHSPAKRLLATLPIVVGRTRNGQAIIRRQKVVEITAAEGRPLEDVVTRTGESLIDYHHCKLAQVLGPDAPRAISLGDVVPACALTPGAGVETQVQAQALSESGCDQLQGYHFARPMPLENLVTAHPATLALVA